MKYLWLFFVAASLLLGGCVSSERMMSNSPFGQAGETSLAAGEEIDAAGDPVELWPLWYSNNDNLSLLWPLYDYDDNGMALRPFFHYDQAEMAILFPLSAWNEDEGWVLNSYWDDQNFGVFPLFNTGEKFNYYSVVWWDEDDENEDDFVYGVFPLFWKSPDNLYVFPLCYFSDDLLICFPFYLSAAEHNSVIVKEKDQNIGMKIDQEIKIFMFPLLEMLNQKNYKLNDQAPDNVYLLNVHLNNLANASDCTYGTLVAERLKAGEYGEFECLKDDKIAELDNQIMLEQVKNEIADKYMNLDSEFLVYEGLLGIVFIYAESVEKDYFLFNMLYGGLFQKKYDSNSSSFSILTALYRNEHTLADQKMLIFPFIQINDSNKEYSVAWLWNLLGYSYDKNSDSSTYHIFFMGF